MDMTSRHVLNTTSQLTWRDRWDHMLARLAWRREAHRVEPGLYAVGAPTSDSPVLVTANYTLSFDAVREALTGRDAFILVLDTRGINVWCAAGKGTFGTAELVKRVQLTGLKDVVHHRSLIVPQLGATGVAAHEVRHATGFSVEYGPIRASDIGAYLDLGRATPEMRRARFGLVDRAVLIPVEVVGTLGLLAAAASVLLLLVGWQAALAAVVAVWSGNVLFPLLLPWLPTEDFSTKGWVLGLLTVLPLALGAMGGSAASWRGAVKALGMLLSCPAVTAFVALNFTGSTPFTSRTGVRREIFTYVRWMAVAFAGGMLAVLVLVITRLLGGVA